MIEKETVCIATDETKKQGYSVPNGFIGKYGYFFTKEQLNEYTEKVIKESLEIASEKAKVSVKEINVGHDYEFTDTINIVNKQSIINSFNEIYEKLEV